MHISEGLSIANPAPTRLSFTASGRTAALRTSSSAFALGLSLGDGRGIIIICKHDLGGETLPVTMDAITMASAPPGEYLAPRSPLFRWIPHWIPRIWKPAAALPWSSLLLRTVSAYRLPMGLVSKIDEIEAARVVEGLESMRWLPWG
jgi:hypothetical protein